MLSSYRLWRSSHITGQASIPQVDLPRAAWLAFTPLPSSFPYLRTLQVFTMRSMSFGAQNLLKYVRSSISVQRKAS